MSDQEFISSGSAEEESEDKETFRGKKRRKKNIISSEEDDQPSADRRRDRGKRKKKRSEEEVTPIRRSKRQRPSRHSSTTMRGLRKFVKSKYGKGHPDSSPSGTDSEDDDRPAASGPNDDFLMFTQGRKDNDRNPGSPRPGPSGVSENRPGSSGVSENRPERSLSSVGDPDNLNCPEEAGNCSKDADKDIDNQSGVEGCEKSVDGDKASFEARTEEDSDDTLVGMDEEEMTRILRFVLVLPCF